MKSLRSLAQRMIGYNPLAWEMASSAMDRRVAELLSAIDDGGEAQGDGPDCLVVISPWLGTSVPWFTLATALMMGRRGAKLRFVIDDLPYGANRLRHRHVLRSLRHVMRRVAPLYEVLTLSELEPAQITADQKEEIARLAALNATWVLRGEMRQAGRAELVALEIRQNELAQQYISSFFDKVRKPELLFVPGGVFGHSGLWMREARCRSIRIGSFDAGGDDVMIVAANGIACQLADIPEAFESLRNECENDPATRKYAIGRANEEIAKRKGGRDHFLSQLRDAGAGTSEMDGGVLLALNSSWDAAALGPHRVYESSTAWILGTTRYLLENTDRPVIVRQHPAERLPIAATSEDYPLMLRREFGEHERLHFIAAEDPINSYALMEKVAAVVVHTSTFGIEAAASGVPVITGSASFYARLGFAHFADNLADYEHALGQAATDGIEVTQAMRDNATLCFYLTQCCNWIFSPFNPANFSGWLKQPLAYWADQERVDRMIESLITGTPVATLNHRAAFDAEAAA